MNDDFTSSYNARKRSSSDLYMEEFHRATVRRLARGKHARIHELDRDDIASRMALRVWLRLDDYRRRYPQPDKLASVMLNQAIIGHLRAEGAQRGAGARGARIVFHLHDPGLPVKAQEDAPRLNADDPYAPVRRRRQFRVDLSSSITSTPFDGHDDYVDHDALQESCHLLDAALLGRGVDERGRWLLQRVDGDGRTVTDVAHELGIARETAQRALGKARQAARAAADQWRADGRPLPW